MTGKKKKKKDVRKVHGDLDSTRTTDLALVDAITQGLKQDPAIVSASKNKLEGEVDTSPNLVEIVEPSLSRAVPRGTPPLSASPSLPSEGTTRQKSLSPAFSVGEELNPLGPSFVFSAGQNTPTKRATTPIFLAHATESTTVHNARNSKQYARRRESKCPLSERFGKMGRSRQQILQLSAQEVAFGQGRDPLSLVVSYEENGLRRIVKVPEGCTSETIVDSSLRQAVAGAAVDSAGWQKALNHPKEDEYFAYGTAPEGMSVAKFREIKGKVLITPLSTDCGLLKLKEEAERKRRAAEEKLEKVKEYLQRLLSEGEKLTAGAELSEERGATCAHCKSTKNHVQDLLKIVTLPQSGDPKKISETAKVP